MDPKLYEVAEAAYQQYDQSNEIGGQLLLGWFLAEIHFVGTITDVLSVQLNAWPKNDLEHTLVIRIAHAYREIRKDAQRAEKIKPKGDIHAVRTEEL